MTSFSVFLALAGAVRGYMSSLGDCNAYHEQQLSIPALAAALSAHSRHFHASGLPCAQGHIHLAAISSLFRVKCDMQACEKDTLHLHTHSRSTSIHTHSQRSGRWPRGIYPHAAIRTIITDSANTLLYFRQQK